MSENPILSQLLENWETLRSQGAEPTAAVLCRGHEELIPDLEQRIDRKKTIERLIEDWEDQVDEGKKPKVEDVCREHPELLDEFREEVAALDRFDSLFGGAGDSTPRVEDVREFCDGRYDVQQVYASGGLGVLYHAVDRELGRSILVKTMLPRISSVPESRQHFEREAHITGELEHPGVVPVYGFGRDSAGRPYYAMKLVRGETLREAIRRFHESAADESERSLDFQKLLRSFIAVCQTVAFAHSRQIIHRDLKPQNIMLGKYGEVLVIDWGLAKKTAEADPESAPSSEPSLLAGMAPFKSQTAVKGTPSYMSPEQASLRKELIGPASDIFSLGATLFEILTGQRPFSGRSSEEVLAQVTSGNARHAAAVNPKTPLALDAICVKAMRTDPVQRYSDAQQLADDVDRYLADEPVSAWQEPWTHRWRRAARRHRALSTGIGAAAAVGIVSISIAAALLAAKDRQLSRTNNELVARNEEMRQDGYVTKFLAAKEERDRGRSDVARRVLDELDVDLRGPEWGALKEAVQPVSEFGVTPRGQLATTRLGWGSIVPSMTHVDISNDGALVAAATRGEFLADKPGPRPDWQVEVHDVRSKALLHKFHGSGWIQSLRFSRDSRRLGAIVAPFQLPAPTRPSDALAKNYEKLWKNPQDFKRYQSLLRRAQRGNRAEPKTEESNSKAAQPNVENTPKNLEDMHPPIEPPKPDKPADNRLSAAAAFKAWDAITGAELDVGGAEAFRTAFGEPGPGPREQPKSESLKVESADGRLAAEVATDGRIRVYWKANRHRVTEVRIRDFVTVLRSISDRVWAMRFDADAKHLLWVGDDEILRSVPLPRQPQKLSVAPSEAPSAALAIAPLPGGDSLISVHNDGFVRIWSLGARRETTRYRFSSAPIKSVRQSFALSPEGSWLAVVEPGAIRVLEASTGREAYRLANVYPPVAFSSDGATLVAIQQPSSTASAANGGHKSETKMTENSTPKEARQPKSTPGDSIVYRNLNQKELAEFAEQVEAGDHDREQTGLLVVDTKTGVGKLLRASVGGIFLPRDIAISPRGDKFAILHSNGKDVAVWDFRTGDEQFHSIAARHEKSPANSLFYGPDGATIVTVDSVEANVWDVEPWRVIATLQGHTGEITAVEFLSDGKRIATASRDGRLGLWDQKTGFLLWYYEDWDGSMLWSVRQIDGNLVAGSNQILFWDTPYR